MPQAFEEYVKAWFAIQIISREYGLGSPDGFLFNMSVGYDLEGIKSPKIDRFLNGMRDASQTDIYRECRQWILDHADRLTHMSREEAENLPSCICNSVTLSTLHGCPSQEIEKIAGYLLKEKGFHTFIKCNPTLLGYEYARETLDAMGYGYVEFGDFHFRDDLQYEDAVLMLTRLMALADGLGLSFGVKITNTFPVDIRHGELPGQEMYMSGRSLYPLSISLAAKLAAEFDGKLRISYSGGADYFNIGRIYDAGIWPVTIATTVLKPGGYGRMVRDRRRAGRKRICPVYRGECGACGRTGKIREDRCASHEVREASAVKEDEKEGASAGLFCIPLQGGMPDSSGYYSLYEAGQGGALSGGSAGDNGEKSAAVYYGYDLCP